ncbi:MAG: iron-containing alcohol dehydrogenase [Sphingomonas sp.]|uniref:iron-containing alcohol dehydrogenase n=1 Tax=Sphingomonas sp. TaxID=28214 RepID=UPI00178E2248|nr:iron-containing alcohol dehydrogenase [Sphingomonas sp.]MBA3666280.1 iron-containing alcohol dehydrogenase [Sphingomonas sp.]
MRPFTFHYGPSVLSGSDGAEGLVELLPEGRCLFVTDDALLSLGLPDRWLAAMRERCEVAMFSAVEADPSLETLLAAVEVGRRHDVTHVVGFGGGSPMDVAKLAAYLLGSGDVLDEIWGVELAKGQGLPLSLVPTTAGTGSEATPISVITVEGGTKLAVNARALTAKWALLDPTLTIGLPRHVTAATGIDAIVHAVEAYTSARLKNPVSDALAREALRLLSANLLTACNEPANLEARSAMLLGAHLAGVAFSNAPVAGVHALAYPLGGIHHLPHGLSNALMLRHVLQHNSEVARDDYAELAEILAPDCAGQGSQAKCAGLINRLDQLATDSGLALRLRDHGVPEGDIPMLAQEAMKQQRLLVNNPCPIDEADARRLYEAAW